MAEVFTRRLTRWQVEQHQEALADGFVEAYRPVAGEEFQDRQRFVQRLTDDARRPGFDLVLADDAGESSFAGCVYGYRLARADTWWQDVAGIQPRQFEELTASGEVFVVAELMVPSERRRRHIATDLVEELLGRVEETMAIALVDPTNAVARAAFQTWGWARSGAFETDDPGSRKREIWSLTREP